jgi:hypothetical protein
VATATGYSGFEKRLQTRRLIRIVAVITIVSVATVVILIGVAFDYPRGMKTHGAFAGLAALLGAIVGAAELTSRYRDEPIQALMSNSGVGYLLMNGGVSALTYGLVARYSSAILPGLSHDQLTMSIVAGFGAMAILRSKFFTISTERGANISVGPDAAVEAFLSAADRGVDRARAARRLALVFSRAARITHPDLGRDFIEISLAAFQNLNSDDQAKFIDLLDRVDKSQYNDVLKLQAICYAMLRLTGEKNFGDIMTNLEEYVHLHHVVPPPEPNPPAEGGT